MVFNNVTVAALVDKGSLVCLLHEDVYKQTVSLPKLSKKWIHLTRIGSSEVWVRGSFEHEVNIDVFVFPHGML